LDVALSGSFSSFNYGGRQMLGWTTEGRLPKTQR
jgi:hypothetical protein